MAGKLVVLYFLQIIAAKQLTCTKELVEIICIVDGILTLLACPFLPLFSLKQFSRIELFKRFVCHET
jgi:hypothetical protein